MDKINVLIVEPEKKPYAKEIDTGLEAMQNEVGGYIQAIYPFDEAVAIVCNEEGKINGLPLNRALWNSQGEVYDIIVGTFVVVGLSEESFSSLSKEQMKQFSERFKAPERFVKVADSVVVFPMTPEEGQKFQETKQNNTKKKSDDFSR